MIEEKLRQKWRNWKITDCRHVVASHASLSPIGAIHRLYVPSASTDTTIKTATGEDVIRAELNTG